jgi:hypothetical protein
MVEVFAFRLLSALMSTLVLAHLLLCFKQEEQKAPITSWSFVDFEVIASLRGNLDDLSVCILICVQFPLSV